MFIILGKNLGPQKGNKGLLNTPMKGLTVEGLGGTDLRAPVFGLKMYHKISGPRFASQMSD